ncbi:MAG: sel1 repeat family protein [Thiobacillus sp.]|nr:sel1 repeat family protein [Thiobacillus sp.]
MARTCPQCGSQKLRSARVHAHDGIRRMLLFTPLRCRECHHRFWVFDPLKPLLLVLVAGALVVATVWFAQPGSIATLPPPAPVRDPHALASSGDANAQLALGIRYQEGDGVIKNDTEAAKWFARAAKSGLAEAQYRYGLALLEGRGVVQDYKAAFAWIKKTAERGYAPAQLSLGELYRFGTGTEIDKARAYLWFNLAAAQGVEAAAKARDSVVVQLKPEQVAAMQEEARRMSPAGLMHATQPDAP